MNKKNEDFKKKAESLGYVVRDYSGRGMYGKSCYGVTVDNFNDFIAEMGMKGLKVDNMGRSFIVYVG